MKDEQIVFYLPDMEFHILLPEKLPPEVSRSVEKRTIDYKQEILAVVILTQVRKNVEILTGNVKWHYQCLLVQIEFLNKIRQKECTGYL